MEELLKYARENYPPGTKCLSALHEEGGGECLVSAIGAYEEDISGSKDVIWCITNGKQAGWLYCDGRWAKIISKPKLNYEIY